MRTFAEKPIRTLAANPSPLARGRRVISDPGYQSNQALLRSLGNSATRRASPAPGQELEAKSPAGASPRFAHDFSRIPVHAPAPATLQTKLQVNTPGDAYEQEADRVAEQVMRMPEPQLSRTGADGGNPTCQNEQPAHEQLQTTRVEKGDTEKITVPRIVHEVIHSTGQPLDSSTREFMEPRFGHDFSNVRVHTDARASESAHALNAIAYAGNSNIVFGRGYYEPASTQGRHLLAHELTHVVQQRTGVHLKDGVGQAGDSYERQADAAAREVMHGGSNKDALQSHSQLRGPPSRGASESGFVLQKQTGTEVFDTTDVRSVKDKWAKSGAASESDIARQLEAYKKWHDAYTKAATAAKKAKTRVLTDTRLETVATWIGTYELHEQWKAVGAGKEPADPGIAPPELAQLGGNPPAPAYEKIKKYDVTVPGGSSYSYKDHVKSPYTERETGVGDAGTIGGQQQIGNVFDKAGVSATDPAMVKKAFSVLSELEGKFDAINTYDAGYISAGFIQFISGSGGNASLAKVLRDMKTKNPTDFSTNFHNLGIDVDANGLVVVDPADGTVLHGADAVQKVISDKRLTAVFQEAGKSDSFQEAQARIAYEQYYVPDKSFSLALNVKDTDPAAKKKTKTVTVTGKYGDVLLSEAGKVAIVDRGVQHGTGGKHGKGGMHGPGGAAGCFIDACQEVVDKHDLTDPTVADLAKYESEIVTRLVNRYAVSTDATLTQPAPVPATTSVPIPKASD